MLDALVIGGTLVDNILKFKEPHQMETCTHAVNTVTMGGVALNIARNLSARYHNEIAQGCVVGNDPQGDNMIKYLRSNGIEPAIEIRIPEQPTGSYMGFHDRNGDLVIAAAVKGIYSFVHYTFFEKYLSLMRKTKAWIFDTSFQPQVYSYFKFIAAPDTQVYVIISEVGEATNIIPILSKTTGLFCNADEIKALATYLCKEAITDIKTALEVVAKTGVKTVFATDGANGVHCINSGEYSHHAAPKANVVCVNGAGDAFASAVIDAFLHKQELAVAIEAGLSAAKLQIEGHSEQISRIYRPRSVSPRAHRLSI